MKGVQALTLGYEGNYILPHTVSPTTRITLSLMFLLYELRSGVQDSWRVAIGPRLVARAFARKR